MNFENEFITANERRSQFGLPLLPFIPRSKRLVTAGIPESLANSLKPHTMRFDAQSLAFQCLAANKLIRPSVSAFFDCDAVFTIGYLRLGDESCFFFTNADLLDWKTRGVPSFEKVELHAWLTLPTMEIIDITFGTSVAAVIHRQDLEGAAIMNHYSQLKGISYHPMILGEDILPLIGVEVTITIP